MAHAEDKIEVCVRRKCYEDQPPTLQKAWVCPYTKRDEWALSQAFRHSVTVEINDPRCGKELEGKWEVVGADKDIVGSMPEFVLKKANTKIEVVVDEDRLEHNPLGAAPRHKVSVHPCFNAGRQALEEACKKDTLVELAYPTCSPDKKWVVLGYDENLFQLQEVCIAKHLENTKDKEMDKVGEAVVDLNGEWPHGIYNKVFGNKGSVCYYSGEASLLSDDGGPCGVKFVCSKREFEEAKTRLQNKPLWCDAPEWANWLAQDSDGEWLWFGQKPRMYTPTTRGIVEGWRPRGMDTWTNYDKGVVFGAWQDTLEERPQSKSKHVGPIYAICRPDGKIDVWRPGVDLPPIGCKCEIGPDWEVVRIVGHDEDVAIGRKRKGVYASGTAEVFRPHKTEKDQVVDKAVKETKVKRKFAERLYSLGMLKHPDSKEN